MKTRKVKEILRWCFLSLSMPVLTGCNGGGSALGVGSLFGVSGSGNGGDVLAGLTGGNPESIAAIHNPEPASMLLFGAGAVALGYINLTKRK